MKYFSLTMKSLVAFMFLCNGNIFADESTSTTEQKDERHAPAGDRALAPKEAFAIQEKYANEPQETVDTQDSMELIQAMEAAAHMGVTSLKTGASALTSINTPKASVVYVTTHPGAIHWPVAKTPLNESVELEDGSIWTIHPSDRYKVFGWLSTDLLLITPSHSWFSVYKYWLRNQNTNDVCDANLILYLSPVFHTIYNHRIVAFDDVLKMIWLEDGSVWSVSSFDYSYSWLIGDTVIIGTNDGWLSSSRPNILINCNVLQHVRANCLSY